MENYSFSSRVKLSIKKGIEVSVGAAVVLSLGYISLILILLTLGSFSPTPYPVHPSQVSLSGGLVLDDGALSEPLAIGVYAVKQSIPMAGAKVGILGFGPIGMSVMLPAKALGAETIYVTDKVEERLAMARNTGAVYTGNPDKEDVVAEISKREPMLLDVVFECCGKQEAMGNAIDILKPGGKLMLIGIPEFDNWQFSADKGRRKEITITNVRRQNHALLPTLEMMRTKKIDGSLMLTHRFPFIKTKEAFDMVEAYEDGVMKAMIDFD